MITLALPKIPAINLAMNSTNTAHSSASLPIGSSHSLMGKFFVLTDERGLRYSSYWTYHVNRVIIVHSPQNAQSLFWVSEEFCANMLRYPFMPEGILGYKVATAVAENEHQHMRVLPRMIKENYARDQEEAEAKLLPRGSGKSVSRIVRLKGRLMNISKIALKGSSDFYNFDDDSDDELGELRGRR